MSALDSVHISRVLDPEQVYRVFLILCRFHECFWLYGDFMKISDRFREYFWPCADFTCFWLQILCIFNPVQTSCVSWPVQTSRVSDCADFMHFWPCADSMCFWSCAGYMSVSNLVQVFLTLCRLHECFLILCRFHDLVRGWSAAWSGKNCPFQRPTPSLHHQRKCAPGEILTAFFSFTRFRWTLDFNR